MPSGGTGHGGGAGVRLGRQRTGSESGRGLAFTRRGSLGATAMQHYLRRWRDPIKGCIPAGKRSERERPGKDETAGASRPRRFATVAAVTRQALAPLPAWEGSGGTSRRGFGHLGIGGETAGLLFGEAQLAVHRDLEHAVAASDQIHFGRRRCRDNDVPRRTGARFIPSSSAVFDFHLHDRVLCGSARLKVRPAWRAVNPRARPGDQAGHHGRRLSIARGRCPIRP